MLHNTFDLLKLVKFELHFLNNFKKVCEVNIFICAHVIVGFQLLALSMFFSGSPSMALYLAWKALEGNNIF